MQVNSSSNPMNQQLQDRKAEEKEVSKDQVTQVKQDRSEEIKSQEAAKITGIGQSLNIIV